MDDTFEFFEVRYFDEKLGMDPRTLELLNDQLKDMYNHYQIRLESLHKTNEEMVSQINLY